MWENRFVFRLNSHWMHLMEKILNAGYKAVAVYSASTIFQTVFWVHYIYCFIWWLQLCWEHILFCQLFKIGKLLRAIQVYTAGMEIEISLTSKLSLLTHIYTHPYNKPISSTVSPLLNVSIIFKTKYVFLKQHTLWNIVLDCAMQTNGKHQNPWNCSCWVHEFHPY